MGWTTDHFTEGGSLREREDRLEWDNKRFLPLKRRRKDDQDDPKENIEQNLCVSSPIGVEKGPEADLNNATEGKEVNILAKIVKNQTKEGIRDIPKWGVGGRLGLSEMTLTV